MKAATLKDEVLLLAKAAKSFTSLSRTIRFSRLPVETPRSLTALLRLEFMTSSMWFPRRSSCRRSRRYAASGTRRSAQRGWGKSGAAPQAP